MGEGFKKPIHGLKMWPSLACKTYSSNQETKRILWNLSGLVLLLLLYWFFLAGLNDLHSPATSKVWRNHSYQSHIEQASQELRMVFPATTYSEGKAWKLMMEVFKISITTKHEAIRDVQLGVVKFVSHFICAQIFQMKISALPLILSVLSILDNFLEKKWTAWNGSSWALIVPGIWPRNHRANICKKNICHKYLLF